MKRVVLFDIDGTLLSSGGAGQAAMEAALKEEFQAVRPVSDISTAGRTDRAILCDLFQYYGVEKTEANWNRMISSYLMRLPLYLQNLQGKVLPGCRELVEHLAQRDDVELGLLTGNVRAGANVKLGHFQMWHHFRFGGFGDVHQHRDDVARDAWKEIEHRYPHIAPDQVWVVGDTPADVQCGRAIGAKVLAVATGQYSVDQLKPHGADVTVSNLQETDRWIEVFAG